MPTRRDFLQSAAIPVVAAMPAHAKKRVVNDREQMLVWLAKLALPVLEAAAAGKPMPAEGGPALQKDRGAYSTLEGLSRTLMGMGPWLALSTEKSALHARCQSLAVAALERHTAPASLAPLLAHPSRQALVEMAFLAQMWLASPAYWQQALPKATTANLIAGWAGAAAIPPHQNNWLLFAAMCAAAWGLAGDVLEPAPIATALAKMESWYLGDGHYGDGPRFHADYYNSFVIHPLLLALYEALPKLLARYPQHADALKTPVTAEVIVKRAQRYALVLERLVGAEGAMPATGRSLCYRTGILHLPARLALAGKLPEALPHGQARRQLMLASQRFLSAKGVFSADGWLRPGMYGYQPNLAELYIQTGSLYLACAPFCVLGLPTTDPFWTAPQQPLTSEKLARGADLSADHALD